MFYCFLFYLGFFFGSLLIVGCDRKDFFFYFFGISRVILINLRMEKVFLFCDSIVGEEVLRIETGMFDFLERNL